MSYIEIAGLCFGKGRPKICVPLTGRSMPELLSEARMVRDLPADLYEWRIDCFFGTLDSALDALRGELGEKPLLCTVRTAREGGEAELSPEEYRKQLLELLDLGNFQILDIELSAGEEIVTELKEKAKKKGIGVVISRHDFEKTPPEEEMAAALEKMKALGADLPKLAVMPKSPEDVLALLSATLSASRKLGPVITMSMGSLGKVSRVSGEIFGSCMTFGVGKAASAPGQIDTEDLLAILEDVSPEA